MLILSKKRYMFRLDDLRFTTKGGGEIETAPDWIRKDPYFELVFKDGDILELVNNVTVPVADAAAIAAAAAKVADDAAKAQESDVDKTSKKK